MPAPPPDPSMQPATGRWRITHVTETGSTNADLVAQAAGGAPDGTVLVADLQRGGRGRLGRTWSAPAGSALLMSVLVRPHQVPLSARGWIGALLGLAVVRALDSVAGVAAQLKWPNDVLIAGDKVAGILAEMAGDALVVGTGINLSLARADLPRPDATSLALAGVPAARRDRESMLQAVLAEFGPIVDRWSRAGGDMERSGLRSEYLARSATVGGDVVVHLPDGSRVVGVAVNVAPDGALVVRPRGATTVGAAGLRRFAAGDVQHLRRAGGTPDPVSQQESAREPGSLGTADPPA